MEKDIDFLYTDWKHDITKLATQYIKHYMV